MLEEFINVKQVNVSVEEYCLKYSKLYIFSQSLVSILSNEMSRFMTGVVDLVKEEYYTVMLHDDMNLYKLMLYAQSIEESKLERISRNMTRIVSSDQSQSMSMERIHTQDRLSAPKVIFERGGGSKNGKLCVLLVERDNIGNIYCVPGVGFDVVKMDTKLRIVVIYLLEMVSKLLLLFRRMMLK